MLLMESTDLYEYTLEEANKIIEQFINKSYLEKRKKINSCYRKRPTFLK